MTRSVLLLAVILAGCGIPEYPYATDVCLRRELFTACMAALPAGPAATHYNDWSDVVSACGDQAIGMAQRQKTLIKEECRGS